MALAGSGVVEDLLEGAFLGDIKANNKKRFFAVEQQVPTLTYLAMI